jgi:hypothetical protein
MLLEEEATGPSLQTFEGVLEYQEERNAGTAHLCRRGLDLIISKQTA